MKIKCSLKCSIEGIRVIPPDLLNDPPEVKKRFVEPLFESIEP
jgi:hypothetical protein